MSRKYDSHTTTFSPEGRLHQIEYAMKAIENSSPCVGIYCSEGIVVVAEKRAVHPLLDVPSHAEKIYQIHDDMICTVAGATADASVLIEELKRYSRRHYVTHQEPIRCEDLILTLCELKHGYTLYGGLRPFGVSFIYAGWDKQKGFQLFCCDPSGNYVGYKATCIGNNSGVAVELLKKKYRDDLTLNDAVKLAFYVLTKSTLAGKLIPEKFEVATITKASSTTDIKISNFSYQKNTNIYFYTQEERERLINVENVLAEEA